jgi:hypothetical protein
VVSSLAAVMLFQQREMHRDEAVRRDQALEQLLSFLLNGLLSRAENGSFHKSIPMIDSG